MDAQDTRGVLMFPRDTVVAVQCQPPNPFLLAITRQDIAESAPDDQQSQPPSATATTTAAQSPAPGATPPQLVQVTMLERVGSYANGDDLYRRSRDEYIRRARVVCATAVEVVANIPPQEHYCFRMAERFRVLRFLRKGDATEPDDDEDADPDDADDAVDDDGGSAAHEGGEDGDRATPSVFETACPPFKSGKGSICCCLVWCGDGCCQKGGITTALSAMFRKRRA
jgi:hypothetical protein